MMLQMAPKMYGTFISTARSSSCGYSVSLSLDAAPSTAVDKLVRAREQRNVAQVVHRDELGEFSRFARHGVAQQETQLFAVHHELHHLLVRVRIRQGHRVGDPCADDVQRRARGRLAVVLRHDQPLEALEPL